MDKLRMVLIWIMAHIPTECAICHKWMWRRDAIYRYTTVGDYLPLCVKCERNIFHPWENYK